MQSTRAKIIDLLSRRGEATVEDLMGELALAPSTVRRHLDVLQRDGQVEIRAVKRTAGRPHFAFSLTTAGRDAVPQHHMRVTASVIEELMSLRPRDTRNKTGYELAWLIFDRLEHRLEQSCRPRVSAEGLAERLEQAVQALAQEGFEFQVTAQEGGFVVQGRGCPCRRLAGAPVEPCVHDQRLVARLTGARVDAIVDEERPGMASYLVRE
jgi:predicted ArsR family transcriptional regulator